jgi:putative redox protein
MSHIVTTVWEGGVQFESDNPSGKTVKIDTDVEGPERRGLSLKAMMLTSLAGCSGLDVVSILEKMKAQPEKFKIVTIGHLTDEHPKYYHTVEVEYHFYGDHLEPAKIDKAVKLSIEKYCGVMEMFRRFATIKTSIHFH